MSVTRLEEGRALWARCAAQTEGLPVSQHTEQMREMREQGYFDCGCEECDREREREDEER